MLFENQKMFINTSFEMSFKISTFLQDRIKHINIDNTLSSKQKDLVKIKPVDNSKVDIFWWILMRKDDCDRCSVCGF